MGLNSGFLKMLFALETRRLLGVHIVGEGATELIHIGQAVLNLEGTLDYFVENTFNYPTLAEAYKVAALDAWNRMPKAQPSRQVVGERPACSAPAPRSERTEYLAEQVEHRCPRAAIGWLMIGEALTAKPADVRVGETVAGTAVQNGHAIALLDAGSGEPFDVLGVLVRTAGREADQVEHHHRAVWAGGDESLECGRVESGHQNSFE